MLSLSFEEKTGMSYDSDWTVFAKEVDVSEGLKGVLRQAGLVPCLARHRWIMGNDFICLVSLTDLVAKQLAKWKGRMPSLGSKDGKISVLKAWRLEKPKEEGCESYRMFFESEAELVGWLDSADELEAPPVGICFMNQLREGEGLSGDAEGRDGMLGRQRKV